MSSNAQVYILYIISSSSIIFISKFFGQCGRMLKFAFSPLIYADRLPNYRVQCKNLQHAMQNFPRQEDFLHKIRRWCKGADGTRYKLQARFFNQGSVYYMQQHTVYPNLLYSPTLILESLLVQNSFYVLYIYEYVYIRVYSAYKSINLAYEYICAIHGR